MSARKMIIQHRYTITQECSCTNTSKLKKQHVYASELEEHWSIISSLAHQSNNLSPCGYTSDISVKLIEIFITTMKRIQLENLQCGLLHKTAPVISIDQP